MKVRRAASAAAICCSSSALRARVGVVEDSSISASRPVSMAWASSTSCSAVSSGYDPSSLR